jgi:hypothetical protein
VQTWRGVVRFSLSLLFLEALDRICHGRFGEVDYEGIHVETVEKACEAFTKSAETLVHELKVHEVCFKIGH